MVLSSGKAAVPFGIHGWLGAPFLAIGQPQRWADMCRDQLARYRDAYGGTFSTWASLVFALTMAGSADEALAAADGLVEAAQSTGNPQALTSALLAFGTALEPTDPDHALTVLRRGMGIATDAGVRFNETMLSLMLSRLETRCGDSSAALEHVRIAVGNYRDSASTINMSAPLAVLAILFDRLGHHEPAATVAGFALNAMTAAGLPEISKTVAHLREALGEQTYESLARKGETMSLVEIATYACNQIDQARAALNAVSK